MAYKINLNDDELMHYGKLGMKWGRHISRESGNVANNAKNLNRAIGNVKNRNTKRMKNIKKMSNEEMLKKINRELLERRYDDLFNPKKVSKGRQRVNDILEIAGPVTGIAASSLGIALAIMKIRERSN